MKKPNEKTRKRRIVNFRSFFIIAISMIASILFMRLNVVVYPLGFVLMSAGILCLLIFFIVSVYKRKPAFKSTTFILAIALSLVAGLQFYFMIRTTSNLNLEDTHFVSGKVDTVDPSLNRILIKNLYINGESTSGRIRVYADFNSFQELYTLQVGDYLIFRARLFENRMLRADGSFNVHAPRSQIRYRVYRFDGGVVAITQGRPGFFRRIQEEMRHTLILAMGQEYAAIAYGMLTGDRSHIAPEIRDGYSAAGLAHILSVSGLHVGFITLTMVKIFKILKVHKWAANAFIMGALIFYAFFVGLSPPIVRAVVMANIMLLSYTFSKRYDSLNALSMAMVVILLFAPFYLFDVGFLFSAGALSGIVFFSRPIRLALSKIKIPKFLAHGLSLSISAQIGIVPAMIYFFESIQVYSVLINVFLHPIISIGFMAIFFTLIAAMLFPPLVVLVQFSGIFIAFIDTVVLSASQLPSALLFVFPAFGAFLFLVYALYFCASRFFMAPKGRKKRFLFKSITLLIAATFLFIGVPLTRIHTHENIVAPVPAFRDVSSVVLHEGRTYIIGDFTNFRATEDTLRRLNVRSIDAVFVFNLNDSTVDAIIRLAGRYRFGKVKTYIGVVNADALIRLAQHGINNVYAFCGLYSVSQDLLPVMHAGRLVGYELLTARGSIVFTSNQYRNPAVPLQVISRAFVIRSFSYLGAHSDRLFLSNVPTDALLEEEQVPANQFTTQEHGRFVFNFESGRVYSLG